MLYILNERYQWGQMLVQHTLTQMHMCTHTAKTDANIYEIGEKCIDSKNTKSSVSPFRFLFIKSISNE